MKYDEYRLMTGDIREDGMVLWSINLPDTEVWVTPLEFMQRLAIEEGKKGHLKEDGLVYNGLGLLGATEEEWITPLEYISTISKERDELLWFERKPKVLKRGDLGEDGKIFVEYNKVYKNGEYWCTPEQVEKRKQYQKEYQQWYNKNPNIKRHAKMMRRRKRMNKVNVTTK